MKPLQFQRAGSSANIYLLTGSYSHKDQDSQNMLLLML
jgi:hypothetical protein